VATDQTNATHPRRHYGRRKGWKLRPHQADLIGTLLPQLLIAPEAGREPLFYFANTDVAGPPPPKVVGRAGMLPASDHAKPKAKHGGGGRHMHEPLSDIWLEIGFGGGEHLAWQAEHHPDIGIIGAEPFVAGMAKLLCKIESRHLANIRLYTEDARDIIAALPDASLGRLFILFPDPWPKTRHHKRRLIQMEMLDSLARVLKERAELRFATDDPGYLTYALERFIAHRAFVWTASAPHDWQVRPADWPETRYEAKALAAGRRCTYLTFRRVS
jgi:tRNA (guanine-N7-)-methyltransferase